jgi:hypothetical protein
VARSMAILAPYPIAARPPRSLIALLMLLLFL